MQISDVTPQVRDHRYGAPPPTAFPLRDHAPPVPRVSLQALQHAQHPIPSYSVRTPQVPGLQHGAPAPNAHLRPVLATPVPGVHTMDLQSAQPQNLSYSYQAPAASQFAPAPNCLPNYIQHQPLNTSVPPLVPALGQLNIQVPTEQLQQGRYKDNISSNNSQSQLG